jgi:enterochelin esterase-like enzyme
MIDVLPRRPLPEELADAARSMAPAYLRRRLARVGVPYLADDDTATFTYVGEARAVRIVHFMARFPEIPPLVRLTGTELWHVTVELPAGSRIEYQIEVEGQERTTRLLDPLNRRSASDPFGANSVAHGPGYADPPWTSPGVDATPGVVEMLEIESAAFGSARTLSVYLPAGFPGDTPYPAAFFHDGSDLLEYAAVTTVLDNLIGAGAIRPMVALLLDPVERNHEYMALPAHGAFVVDDVLPRAITEFNVSARPADRILAGSSLGAVASLATAWRHQGAFDSLVLMSGTFITAVGGPWHRSEQLQPVVDFVADFAAAPGRPASRAWVACGTYEGLVEENRAFVPVLEGTGMAVHYEEPPDGHHWQHWRNNIGNALRALLPPDPPDGTVSA